MVPRTSGGATRWDVRAIIVVCALAVSAATGFTVVSATGNSSQAATAEYVPVMTTVEKTVRVLEHGKTVIKRVHVVQKIYAKPVTVQETRTIKLANGSTRVVDAAGHSLPARVPEQAGDREGEAA